MVHSGLYEQVINEKLLEELSVIKDNLKTVIDIDPAEAPKVLSQYVSDVVEKGIQALLEHTDSLDSSVALVNRIVEDVMDVTKQESISSFSVPENTKQLLAVLDEKDPLIAVGKSAKDLVRPETSIAHSSLFTGALHEPQMFSELKKEIVSSDRIDMLVSFIKWSGLRLIIGDLKSFTDRGGTLRIITTSYMGATDLKAISELNALINTEIKISYNTKQTRLHAKSYVFYRNTGFTTAYVGSSNLSNAALTSGLEWNTKITKKDQSETIDKIAATFEYYWNDPEFERYTDEQKTRLAKALKAEKNISENDENPYPFDITPYGFQQEILDRLEAERKIRGYTHNLLVAATGTGKTVISALDYKRFRKQNPALKPWRLLFVAHREEILKQSLYTFRAVLKDPNFGDLFVGNYRPESVDHLFVSIQTFNAQNFTEKTASDYYDFIIIDEFHHAAAPTYQKLLAYYKPSILLGLTATPERMDGKSILTYFDHRIAAEIRLPEAIDRKLLCPFQYFGVSDTVALNTLKWSAGGYDVNELTRIYTDSGFVAEQRADLIVNSLIRYVTDLDEVKGLGFCASVAHAEYMSRYFDAHRIPSISLSGHSSDEERNSAKQKLTNGEIRFIFVVDLYNEGVDIPEVNTVLFLRPTQSLTIFLQQLGRGLRLSDDKECLTVLDFIGQANKHYNFEEKFAALLCNTSRTIAKEIQEDFVSLPKGCYIHLEKKAQKYILENIRASYGTSAGLINHITSFQEDTGMALTLSNFLTYYHLDPRTVYKKYCFSRLCVTAGVIDDFQEELEETLMKALKRFTAIDSRRWIRFIVDDLPTIDLLQLQSLSEMQKKMLQMLYVTVWDKVIDDYGSNEVVKNLDKLLHRSHVLWKEVSDLLQYKYDHIEFIDQPNHLDFTCPLDVYCTYTRDQLLVAMDYMKPQNIREGVKWLPDHQIDVLLVTLNKSDKEYSPTTMYNDYSISNTLFYWQSQSTTSEESNTGQRYIHHHEKGSKVLLFVREYKKNRINGEAEAYTFLGTANYVNHIGSRPMNITWQLDNPIPARFLKKTNKLVVG